MCRCSGMVDTFSSSFVASFDLSRVLVDAVEGCSFRYANFV